jgi:hypothetical protein
MLDFSQSVDYGSLINLQTLSNFAVVGAFIFTILTFYLLIKIIKDRSNLSGFKKFKKMLSRENQNMMQNSYFTNQNPLLLSESKDLTSQSHEFIRYLYQPVVAAAEWASFFTIE